MMRLRHSGVLVLASFVLSCGSGKKDIWSGEELTVKRPAAVLMQNEISGTILGKRLSRPYGLAVDPNGRLYLVDAGNHRIIQFDITFQPRDDVGGFGSEPGLLDQPSFIVIDNGLNLWVSDVGNKRISRYDSRLNFVDEISLRDDEDPLKFGTPSGLGVMDYGEVWMADRENNRIAIFDNIGRFDRFIGDYGYSGGQLASPEELLFTRDRVIIICDAGNSRLVAYDDYGNYLRQYRNDAFDYPMAAAMGPESQYWVLDGSTGRLFCLSQRGDLLYQTGPQIPGSDISLKAPSDIAFLKDGRLLISDTGNHRVLICSVIYEES
jgi:tripartite motif-containing protein 71